MFDWCGLILFQRVHFPCRLVLNNTVFALYFVIVHSGESAHGGHYFAAHGRPSDAAAIKNMMKTPLLRRDAEAMCRDGEWFRYDDATVRPSSFHEIQAYYNQPQLALTSDSTPYILAYTKVGTLPSDEAGDERYNIYM